MSRFGRRMLGFVLAVCALHLVAQAITFRLEPRRSMYAYAEWRRNPTQATEASWRAALADTTRLEQEYRIVFAVVGALCAGLAAWLLMSKPRNPDFVSLSEPTQEPATHSQMG